MWPAKGEALSRTLEAEAVLADIYAVALDAWVVEVRSMVLPTITAASEPAPDTESIDQNSWFTDSPLLAGLILTGLSTLWSVAFIETLMALGLPLPAIALGDRSEPVIPKAVMRAITSSATTVTGDRITVREVREAVSRVESHYEIRTRRDDFVTSQRETVAAVPALMREKVAAAVREVDTAPPPRVPVVEPTIERAVPPVGAPDPFTEPLPPTVEVVIERQRDAAAAVLTPGSPEVREVARYSGYQAAAVQNAAVIAAGQQSPDDDLEKVWIATMDGKTRDSHFAADGQRVALSGKFAVGVSALEYPGDPLGPPSEIRNCRCRVGVLAADEDIPDEIDRHTERLDGRDSVQVRREGSQADEVNRRKDRGVVRARDDAAGVGSPGKGTPRAPVNAAAAPIEMENRSMELFRTFTDQPIAFIGIETSDGRMLANDIDLSFRSFPQPVMWVKQTGNGHDDAYTVGVMESARVDAGTVLASGYLLNTPESDEAAGLLGHTAARPSVDLARAEWRLTDENGKEISEAEWFELPPDAKVITTITAAELIGVTLVATPAFGDTKMSLDGERSSRDAALVASAAETFRPRVYSRDLFADPGLTEPTMPTMDPETGRVFGHLACFGACHRSIQAQCVMAPRSPSNYAHFHTSPAVRLDDGSRLPVGRLTVGTGHAPDTLRGAPAAAHYDNTGSCFALVRVGEDAHGVWFSGVAAPWATPEQIEMGMASPLSGDWRDFGQGLELVAALAVNTPGFAVRGREDSDGRPVALVASLGPDPRGVEADAVQTLTAADIAEIVERAVSRAYEQRAVDAEVSELLAEAEAAVGPPPVAQTPNDEIAELLAEIQD